MTEDEARTKWCPFTRVSFSEAPTAVCNRLCVGSLDTNKSVAIGFCIASDCMAWRPTFHGMVSVSEKGAEVRVTGGFCGLAGKLNP
jgi:hypothetical protein